MLFTTNSIGRGVCGGSVRREGGGVCVFISLYILHVLSFPIDTF